MVTIEEPAMAPQTRSLHRKLAQVMFEVGRIPKNGTAPAAMGGFKFVQVGDAADVIRKALAEQKVSMIPTAIELISESESETQSKKLMTTVTVRTTWTLTDADTDESIVIQSMGSGADMGDKAIPKAQSNAMKYALLMGFLLSTGDDPELTDSSDRQRRSHADREPRGMTRDEAQSLADATEPVLDGTYSGTGEIRFNPKPPADGNMRDTPDGPFLAFQFFAAPETGEKEGRKIPQVFVHGPLAADLLDAAGDQLKGLVCAVEGDLFRVPWKKDDKAMPPFQRLVLKRIHANGWTLPVPGQTGPGLFDAGVEAELDAALT
jgi:hypothetical protein